MKFNNLEFFSYTILVELETEGKYLSLNYCMNCIKDTMHKYIEIYRLYNWNEIRSK